MSNINYSVFNAEKFDSFMVFDETNKYKPISFKQIDNFVRETINQYGFELYQVQVKSNKKHTKQLHDYVINTGHDKYGFSLKVLNSTDKTIGLKVAGGASAFICTNGLVQGEYQLKRRHFDGAFEEFKQTVMNLFMDYQNQIDNTVIKMNEYDFELDSQAENVKDLFNEIAEDLLEQKAIKKNQFKHLIKEIENPSLDYGYSGSTYADIFNHATLVIQKSNPKDYTNTVLAVHEYFDTNISKYKTV